MGQHSHCFGFTYINALQFLSTSLRVRDVWLADKSYLIVQEWWYCRKHILAFENFSVNDGGILFS